jgi:hypothetical protein
MALDNRRLKFVFYATVSLTFLTVVTSTGCLKCSKCLPSTLTTDQDFRNVCTCCVTQLPVVSVTLLCQVTGPAHTHARARAHIYTYTYIHTYIHTYTYVRTYIHTHTSVYIHTHISIHLQTHIHTHIHIRTHRCIFSCVNDVMPHGIV